MKGERQRAHYRLKFPVPYRPSFMMDVNRYEIMDVSEYGVKLKVDNSPCFMEEENFIASIVFPDGRVFDLSGQVVRIDEGFAGLQLDAPLSISLIRSEALHIISHYS